MTDIALITRNAYNMGFEKGSQITLDTINAYLYSIGGDAFAENIIDASNNGTLNNIRVDNIISEPTEITKPIINPDPTQLGNPKITVGEAKSRGYTGDVCGNPACMAMTVRQNGKCTICDTCGTTTGCS